MESSDEDSSFDTLEEKKLSNEIDADLKKALSSAVGNCEYQQKTVLSAVISDCLEEVSGADGIFVVDENLEDELEKWSERYA